jgi:mono/diheme cytochrome c family protein
VQEDAPKMPDATPDADTHGAMVERGRYIMNNIAACTFCHTPLNPDGTRDNTRLFAGVECLIDIPPCFGMPTCMSAPDPNDGFGCISSRNLTNDATGLKNATDDAIKNAFRNGHRTDGKSIVPLMPYYIFHNMDDADADSVVAYMRTIPPVVHQVPVNEEPWKDMNDAPQPLQAPIDLSTIPMPSSTFPDQPSAMRGRYLTSQIGLCIDCHTPRTNNPMNPFELDVTKFFAGGEVFTAEQLGLKGPAEGGPYPAIINTRNLTPDATGLPQTGTGAWTTQQIKDAISKGKDQMGNGVCAATHGGVTSTYAALADQDLTDIVSFVQSLAPIVNDTSPNCAGPPVP